MSILIAIVIALLAANPSTAQVQHRISTSDVVRVASMAARDEGYNPGVQGVYLDELRTADGKEPISGYTSISLYKDGHPVRQYSIRIETGDVVDADLCRIFQYPDLFKFKRNLLKAFGSKEVSLDDIATEVGCERLKVVPARAATVKKK